MAMCCTRRWWREHMGQEAWRKASGAAKTVIAPGHLASGGSSTSSGAVDAISL
jgi:hypothetical protein